MGHTYCCVVNCKNTGKNSKCIFYRFSTSIYKQSQTQKWITAVNKFSLNGLTWTPKSTDKICSAHFIGNKKGEEEISPNYVPTIFSFSCNANANKIKEKQALDRHNRFMNKRVKKYVKSKPSTVSTVFKEVNDSAIDVMDESNKFYNQDSAIPTMYADKGCQAYSGFLEHIVTSNFACNRYIYNSNFADAEIQTEIPDGVVKISNRKQYKDVCCETTPKKFEDKSVGNDFTSEQSIVPKAFTGVTSINNDEQLIDLAGVSIKTFIFLLKRLDDQPGDNSKMTMENKLLIFLIKIKTGLTFSALSVLFCVHRTTISRNFFLALHSLASATKNLVFWPEKEIVQGTMPECFKPKYSMTRVIIDCTEFRVEMPAAIDNRNFMYSHYKKGYTAKVLIGITPSGFISFKSKIAGGRKSDAQITIESGLIDLLEDGDIVLADKGFPEIKNTIDKSGKKVLLVMPPFLEKKSEFSKEETEETYSIASVHIHVERIMQRIRTYQIINKIPHYLFQHVDDILHIICVLVNLQPPIMSNKKTM